MSVSACPNQQESHPEAVACLRCLGGRLWGHQHASRCGSSTCSKQAKSDLPALTQSRKAGLEGPIHCRGKSGRDPILKYVLRCRTRFGFPCRGCPISLFISRIRPEQFLRRARLRATILTSISEEARDENQECVKLCDVWPCYQRWFRTSLRCGSVRTGKPTRRSAGE
jgi:hypothetical protein